jgi:hypothetical protein
MGYPGPADASGNGRAAPRQLTCPFDREAGSQRNDSSGESCNKLPTSTSSTGWVGATGRQMKQRFRTENGGWIRKLAPILIVGFVGVIASISVWYLTIAADDRTFASEFSG